MRWRDRHLVVVVVLGTLPLVTSDDPRPEHSPPTTGDDDPWAPAADRGGQRAERSDAPAEVRPRRRGLLIAAIVLFGIGAVFTVLAALTPFVLDRDAPTVLYLVAMICAPVGFLLGLLYALLGSRPPRR